MFQSLEPINTLASTQETYFAGVQIKDPEMIFHFIIHVSTML